MNVHFTALGCAKNLIDSEQMLALITDAGHTLVSDPAEADAAVVNTCAFIESAQQEAIDTILDIAQYKTEGRLRRLVVTGCLAQRFQSEILTELPEVDAVLGTASFPAIVEALESDENGYSRFADKNEPLPELDRVISTGPGWAYIKIADGCDNVCAYCAIPAIRGRFRSRPMENILDEARSLAKSGIRELILVAQDVTRYGRDLGDGTTLSTLLRELVKIEGLEWIRLLYLYPDEITDELIETIATQPKIVHYLDIPIQHVNDAVLKAMRRRETKQSITALYEKLRARIPDVILRTSLIVGLPGEGEAEFMELLNFLEEQKLPRVGAFAYSPEAGTPAAKMPNRCSPEEAEQRQNAVMALQSGIMDAFNRSRVGTTCRVLCEGMEGPFWFGRSYADAPEVDEQIYFTGEAEVGKFFDVKILSASEGELLGEIV